MDHRIFAVLALVCLALEGTGCAWMSRRARGEEILMPLQTGSVLHRRVVIPTEPVVVTKKSKKKNESESKRNSPKPPAPEVTEEDETPPAPDRFR